MGSKSIFFPFKQYIFINIRIYSVLLGILISFLLGCSGSTKINPTGSTYNSGSENELDTLKDLVVRKLQYIMSSKETETLPLIKNKTELNIFLTEFWKQRDPTPETAKNEYKEDYYLRIKTADTFFFERKAGSETERGRILLVYGRPDNIYKDILPNGPITLNDDTIIKSYEIWLYDKPPGLNAARKNPFSNFYPGKMKFVFADMLGLGEFDLIFSTEKGERIDPRVYQYYDNYLYYDN